MLKFVGDVNLTDWDFNPGFGIGSLIAKGLNPFSGLDRQDSDLWIGNFEGVASDETNKGGIGARVFRVSPSVLKKLHHLDVYGFANNHAMQHGDVGYLQTWDSLQAFGCKVFGKKDSRSICFEHQNNKISLTGCCLRVDEFTNDPAYWYNPEYIEIEKEIEGIPSDCFKVFYVHWGNEYINRPSTQQKKFAHWLIDKGVDLIIGMHPHILQGYEIYKSKYIFYSLGNFVFDMAWEPTRYGAIVNVCFTEDGPDIGYNYIKIGDDCRPYIISEGNVPESIRFMQLNQLLTIDDNSEEYHAEINENYRLYRKANHKDLVKKFVKHPWVAMSIIKDFIKRRF